MNTLSTTKVALGMFSIAVTSFIFAGVDTQRKITTAKELINIVNKQPVQGTSNLVKEINNGFAEAIKIEPSDKAQVDVFKIQKGIITFNTIPTPGIVFRVQLLAAKNQVPIFSSQFKGLNIREYYTNGIYRYTVGEFKTPGESESLINNLAAMGYDGSFVVAFKDGKSIPVKDAIHEIMH
jgi:hypothetical protein